MSVQFVINNDVLSDVRLAIFDKDGTIIDVHTYWANMVNFRAEKICEYLGLGIIEKKGIMNSMGVDVDRMRIKPEGPVGIKKREIVLKAGVDYLISLGLPDQTELFLEVFREVDESSLNHFDKIIQPIEGLYQMVDRLKDGECKIALATTDLTERAAMAMEHIGLSDSIDFIAGADMIENPKPASDIIDLICKKLNISVKHSVMVGDSTPDVKTGINAGCLASIGVASGLTPREELLVHTSYVIPDISHITVRV